MLAQLAITLFMGRGLSKIICVAVSQPKSGYAKRWVARKRQWTNDNTITASGSAMDVSRDVSPVIHPAARVH